MEIYMDANYLHLNLHLTIIIFWENKNKSENTEKSK